MNAKSLIVSLFLGGLIFLLGGGLGILYQTQQNVAAPQGQGQLMPSVVKNLSSKVIPSIAAYGEITKIDGRNLTLSYQGDSLVIAIKDDAKIYSFIANSAPNPTPSVKPATTPASTASSREITFKDLKIGDNVSANVKVLSNGQLEGFSAIVLPPASK